MHVRMHSDGKQGGQDGAVVLEVVECQHGVADAGQQVGAFVRTNEDGEDPHAALAQSVVDAAESLVVETLREIHAAHLGP